MAGSERTPLLSEATIAPVRSQAPPPYSEFPGSDGESINNTGTLSAETHELPPPYTAFGQGVIPLINCKVCQGAISLEGKEDSYVVKCSACNEATPLRAAPPGKMYIRCTCNLLLIGRAGATRILCPRETCKRVLTVPRTSTDVYSFPMIPRYLCAYCGQLFALEIFTKFTRCPHCRRLLSVGHNYARTKGHAYFLGGIILLGMSVVLIMLTYKSLSIHFGLVVAWIGGFFLAVMFLIRAIYYYGVKTCIMIHPA